jgi:hypothetical protein
MQMIAECSNRVLMFWSCAGAASIAAPAVSAAAETGSKDAVPAARTGGSRAVEEVSAPPEKPTKPVDRRKSSFAPALKGSVPIEY